MPEKRFSPEQMIAMVRQIEVRLARGRSIAPACEENPHLRTELKDRRLKLEIFYSLREAQVIIGAWKDRGNRVYALAPAVHRSA